MRIGLFCLMVLSCGSEEPSGSPPPLASTSRPGDAPSDAGSPDAMVLTPIETPSSSSPSSSSTTFGGTLATSSTVGFGGGGFCKYDITLRDIAIDVVLDANGDVVQASSRALAIERGLDGCPHAPVDPNIHDFTFERAAVTTTGTRIELAGGANNRPKSRLELDVVQSASGYEATGTWRRTDLGAPFDWRVTAKVDLVRK